MYRFVAIADAVLGEIERQVAAYRPERGGALLGPVGLPVVTRFVFDAHASTSGSTFRPSRDLQVAVRHIEHHQPDLELKGMLHSHPGGMNYPSSGDRIAFADSLRGAPWLGRFIVPIVTCGTLASQPHEVQLPSGTISVFVSEPTSGGPVDLQPAQVHVLPVTRHTDSLASLMGGQVMTQGTVEVEGVIYLSSGVILPGLDLHLLLPQNYPTQAPLLLAAITGDAAMEGSPVVVPEGPGRWLLESLGDPAPGTTVGVPLVWNLDVPDGDRLTRAIQARFPAPGPDAGPGTDDPPGHDEDRGGPGGLGQEAEAARIGIRGRLDGAESAELAERTVLIAGAGSGGSLTADALARSGVERFILIDSDTVEAVNLSRSAYLTRDLGERKIVALARHLREINPLVKCQMVAARIQEIPVAELDAMVRGADLVIAATDDAEAQRRLNHFAYARGVPAVFGGVYARARAGEVVFTVPTVTRCYQCTTSTRHQSGPEATTLNYGTGRLNAEPALGADIQHIVTASVKIAIGLLQIGDESSDSSSRALVWDALLAGRNYVILSTVPEYGFFSKVFAETPGQYAYQSVWLGTLGDDVCPACGTTPIDPLEVPQGGPRLTALRPVEDQGESNEGLAT
ncbi:MAG: UBA/THIF-type binding protein [Actinomycetia bacterium]|nr:UBA/THIF-type binding protein [Actinomycetes bacterium]